MAGEKYLITGAQGFFGAWIVRSLLEQGDAVVVCDLKRDDSILSQVIDDPAVVESLPRAMIDVSDGKAVQTVVDEHQPDYILHLAGLQIPTCKANPVLGATVNVIGTLNIFEAAVKASKKVKGIVYASSAGICGPGEDYESKVAKDDDVHTPRTQYGVFKLCNEGNARIYWQDHQVASVGLRPLTVYGVGRELGLTSGPTKAMKAALLGRDYTIGFQGTTVFNYVKDIARIFIDSAKKVATVGGSHACNIRGASVSVQQFVDAIESVYPDCKGRISILPDGPSLPFPEDFKADRLEALLGGSLPLTSLEDGVKETIAHFVKLRDGDRLHDRDL